MTREPNIIHRGSRWADLVVPIAAGGFAWGMGWGPWVAIGAIAAAGIIVAITRPRGPRNWTE